MVLSQNTGLQQTAFIQTTHIHTLRGTAVESKFTQKCVNMLGGPSFMSTKS